MSPPKVAYLLLWFPEPTQTFILEEVNTLAALGLKVEVFCLYGPRPLHRVAGMAPVRVPVSRLGVRSAPQVLAATLRLRRRWGPKAREFLKGVIFRRWRSLETAGEALWAALAGVHLADIFQARGFAHLHAPWANGPATAAWVASTLSGIPFSFAARAHDLHPPDGALLEKLAAAAFVRTNTEANRRYLAGLAPEAAHKLVRIYNGVALPPESRSQRSPRPPYRLLALGRLVPKKGFPVLLEACRQLNAAGWDFHLTLAGEGPERGSLKSLTRKYRLENRVTMTGFVPHRLVPQLFREADLFLMPSQIAPSGDRDGIPNVILEALLHEVPVVAAAVGGIPEVIRPGETGWLVPPGNPGLLAQAVREALEDPQEAGRRAKKGKGLILREFDSVTNYSRLLACLTKTVGAGC